VSEYGLAIAVEVLAQPDAWTCLAQQPRQGGAADFPRVSAQVLFQREQVEAEEEDGARAASA
jgi:hypothetical protein